MNVNTENSIYHVQNAHIDCNKCKIKHSLFKQENLFPDFHIAYCMFHAGKPVSRFSNGKYREIHI